MVSRHEGVRECWIENEKALKLQLEGIQGEKEGVTSELNSLSLQFEELKVDFEKQMKANNEQATMVSRGLKSQHVTSIQVEWGWGQGGAILSWPVLMCNLCPYVSWLPMEVLQMTRNEELLFSM